jgi:signal transduction histidine kinase
MNINKKIISFLIFSFLLVSVIFTFNSISTLKKNQEDNLVLFKKEFLELGREFFDENSKLFHDNLDIYKEFSIKDEQNNTQVVLDFIKDKYQEGKDVVVIDTITGKLMEDYSSPEITYLFNQDIINDYLQENVLNRKIDFDLDNFSEFSNDKTHSVIPGKIHFHIYNDANLMVGFGEKFLTGKIRIEFIERQNEILFRSQMYLSMVIFTSVLIFIIIFMIIVMKIIIIKPLNKILKAVKIITNGDLSKKVEIKSKDEIGTLGLAFNEMTSKLKETYGSLNDEKARLLASINSLKIGFAIIGIDGNSIINNPSLLGILNIKTDSISLDQITKHLKIEGEGLFERLKNCTEDKCIVEIKEIMFGIKYLRLFLNPVFSLSGIPIGGVLLLEDITDEKVLERSKDEFFAVASHELRTPLTAIRGNAEMILEEYKDKVTDENVKEMISDIDEASVRLIDIVNDFLEVSRLEQGNISFKKTDFDILEVAERVISSLRAEAEKKNITLEIIKPESDLPKVFADKEKVNQVLFNLIGNSLKFTDKGSIKVNFEVLDNSLKVRVIDTGKGISIKNESLLFRKFQPAGDNILARDVTKSTGLGLYISKILIDKMDGTIGLEKTESGIGSTFFFTIPLNS